MDKGVMAKSNEMLKANGKRELSVDELEKVAGGGHFTSHEDIDAYCEVVDLYIANFGLDAAIQFVINDVQSNEVKRVMQAEGAKGLGYLLHKILDEYKE